jgi:stage II sporulation protein AA (anti-sigma F factor antagonist)
MKITITEFGDLGTRVALVGKVDIAGAGELDLPLATVAGARRHIVIDMAGVDFISSLGIRHLVTAAKTVGRSGKILCLLNPVPMVLDLLRTVGLHDYLRIVRSEDEARALILAAAAEDKPPT